MMPRTGRMMIALAESYRSRDRERIEGEARRSRGASAHPGRENTGLEPRRREATVRGERLSRRVAVWLAGVTRAARWQSGETR